MKKKTISILFTLFFLFSSIFEPVFAQISYSYDQNGNLTSDGNDCYTYNDANELSKVTNCSTDDTIAEYVYDYQGNRFEKKIYNDGDLQETVYSPNDGYQTVKLASNSATLNTSYYSANDELVAQKNPDGTKEYYLTDNLGSTNILTNSDGNVVEKTNYYPYGQIQSGGTQSKYLFTGQENDVETGLDYYNARYYDPQIQRFIQPDTELPNVYDPQQLNRYSYVRNNPETLTDPTGHFDIPVIGNLVDLAFTAFDTVRVIAGPKDPVNWASLGLDISAAVLPGLPDGSGEIYRVAEHSASIAEGSSDIIHVADDVSLLDKGGDSVKYLTDDPPQGWKLGDPINNYTAKGNVPAWSTVRQRFWKTEASQLGNMADWNWDANDLDRMGQGLAPQRQSDLGLESLELNHVPPQREGGLFNFDIVTHQEHAEIDEYRY